ncbi:MAG: ABC-2 family transporter protein [Clostridia bacterium]|nr:ABC-2 family transporter protein [Clostridia bacterium]
MGLYLKSIWMDMKCELEYKLSFVFTMVASALSTLFTLLGTIILLRKFGSVDGWTISEVMLVTGIAVFGHVVTEMFGRGLDHFYKQVKSGLLDRILVRPRSITLQVLCSDFQASKIGRLLEAIVILIYGIATVNVEWSFYKILVLIMMVGGSAILFFSILLLKASFSFWTIEGMEFMNILSDGGRDLASYPISIYQKWFANIFTYVIPFGCVNYFPLLYLLGKGNAPFWYGLTPLVTLLFLVISFGVWKVGLASYQSTGS